MKLQKLIIHNIASIEDATIDFGAQPLADSEVFLITGKTGAGKSTILDAICLALYANTPRLDSTKMQGDTQDGEKQVKIDDPRQLMRRNTGEAFVTLTFLGSNGMSYEATWSVERARRKPTGNMKKREWTLRNLDADVTLTTAREIQAEIQAAIGLDFRQFCRTTLLAQGEFTRFLNSKDDEKAEILEKITGVDIYTKIGAKVYELTNQKKRAWEDAQQLVSNMHTLTEDEISQTKTEMAALEMEYREVKARYDQDKQKSDWLRTSAALAEKVRKATEESRQATAITASETFRNDELLVMRWQTTIDARSWLTAKNNAVRNTAERKQEIVQLQATVDREHATLTETLRPTFEKSCREAEAAKVLLDRQQSVLKSQEETVAALNMPQLRRQHEEARDMLQNIKTANELVTSLAEAKEKAELVRQALAVLLASIESNQRKLEEYVPKMLEAESRMKLSKEVLDKQKDTIDKFAKAMRQKLNVGDKCPVCGQLIADELPHEDELTALVDGLTASFKESEKDYNNIVAERHRLAAEINAARRTYERDKDSLEKDKTVATLSQRLSSACRACGIETSDADVRLVLKDLKDKTSVALVKLDGTIRDGEQKEKEVGEQRAILDKMRNDWDVKKAIAEKNRQAADACMHRIAVAKELVGAKQKDIQQLAVTIATNQRLVDDFLARHRDLTEEVLSTLDGYSSQAIARKHEVIDQARRNELTHRTLLQAAVRQQEEHQQNRPELGEDDTLECLGSRMADGDRQLTAVNIRKGELSQKLKTDAANRQQLGTLKAEADSRKEEYLKWGRMNQLIGDANGSKFRKIAQSYVLTSLIHSANGYMKTLTDRYTLRVTPGTFVILLEDAYQGYVCRAASTISGGESFLVSLSLALALSDIGQRLSVDMLFIDEGFGTLSGEPLQNAVNTLRSLHSKSGRHVGIISHVEELQDRIPVQIQVIQQGNNSSSMVNLSL